VLYLSADRSLWTADNVTSKIVKYDIEGHYLYSWGSQGQWPGAFWNIHGMSVDSDGNLYVAEVNSGRFEKFRPRKGANPAFLVGQPIRSAS
jgi:sugar lactone lactonase YvrE